MCADLSCAELGGGGNRFIQILGGGENARIKWDSWMRASTFSKEEAMAQYVSVALSVVKSREGGRGGLACFVPVFYACFDRLLCDLGLSDW